MKSEHRDLLVSNTTLHLQFTDRLKVLLGWLPNVQTDISFEKVVGKHEVVSSIITLSPPSWMPKRKHPGYIEP